MSTALVTGVSSGMGLHCALELVRLGHTVHGTVRRAEDGAELARAGGLIHVLDVRDAEGAASLVDSIAQSSGLDILINNAGRGAVGTAEQLPMAVVRDQMETNFFSAVALTQAALRHMRPQGRGTILTVTSVGGVVGQPFNDAYCASKFAVEGFMQSLAPVAAAFGVRVGVFEPAAVATGFVDSVARDAVMGDDGSVRDDPYAPLIARYLERASAAFASAQTAESAGAALASAAVAESDEWKPRWQSSEAAVQFVSASLADLDGQRVHGLTSGWIAESA